MSRKFGIELEVEGGNLNAHDVARILTDAGVTTNVEGYNHATRRTWKIVTDGSLVGRNMMEIVSPVLSGAKGIAQVTLVARTLTAAGVGVNNTCGFHVHVSARDLTAEAFKNLCKLVIIHEDHFKSILPASRRASRWAAWPSQHLSQATVAERCAAVDACADFNQLRTLWGGSQADLMRYRALNLEAFGRHTTVEFRAHSGTVEAQKIAAWIDLCVAIVRRAAGDTVSPVWGNGRPRNFWDLVLSAGKKHKEYFVGRRDHFSRRENLAAAA